MNVYLVWDVSRAEHGELPTLAEICATQSVAEKFAVDNVDLGEDEDQPLAVADFYEIEERNVRLR